jgi:hypothetical protein
MTDLHATMTDQKMIDREALTICDLPRRDRADKILRVSTCVSTKGQP